MSCAALLEQQPIEGVRPTDPHAHVNLDPVPAAAALARKFVLEQAAAAVAEPADLLLLTSELVTNGLLHARTPLSVGVTRGRSRVLVTVADRDSGHPVPPPPDHNRPSGRGIVLVDTIAAQWGVTPVDGGKVVWFTLPAAGPAIAGGGEPS